MVPQITTTNELLIKLDNMKDEMDRRFDDIGSKITTLDRDLKGEYVTQKEFAPIRAIIYGQVSIILVAFVGMLIYVVGWAK